MTALGIDCSSNEPEKSFDQKPGRANLIGQQKPTYLLEAIKAEDSAYAAFSDFEVECVLNNRYEQELPEIKRLEAVWMEAQRKRAAAYRMWQTELSK